MFLVPYFVNCFLILQRAEEIALFEKLESGDFPEAVEELVVKNKIDLNDCYKVNLLWSSCLFKRWCTHLCWMGFFSLFRRATLL